MFNNGEKPLHVWSPRKMLKSLLQADLQHCYLAILLRTFSMVIRHTLTLDFEVDFRYFR